MPRSEYSHGNKTTDTFALASAIHYILLRYEPYLELDPLTQEQEIVVRFRTGDFPDLGFAPINRVTHRAWAGGYESADEMLQDLLQIIESHRTELVAMIDGRSLFAPRS